MLYLKLDLFSYNPSTLVATHSVSDSNASVKLAIKKPCECEL